MIYTPYEVDRSAEIRSWFHSQFPSSKGSLEIVLAFALPYKVTHTRTVYRTPIQAHSH